MLTRMRYLMLSLLTLTLLTVSGICAAQTVIHHCTGSKGTPVFTDQPCASLGAVPAASTANPLAPHAPTGPTHCPMDIPALRKRVAAVFKAHDANALAGLMLWRGYGARGATDTVQHLAQLMQWPFLGFVRADKNHAPAPAASAARAWLPPLATAIDTRTIALDSLTLKLGNPAQPRVSFRITRRDGCYWLEP